MGINWRLTDCQNHPGLSFTIINLGKPHQQEKEEKKRKRKKERKEEKKEEKEKKRKKRK